MGGWAGVYQRLVVRTALPSLKESEAAVHGGAAR
jgi:hypothetical protein